jgi:hypothetical protein
MSDKSEAPEAEGTVSKSHEWVTGQGGPNFSQGGMEPGGSEMENWKKVPSDQANAEGNIEEQAENLRERVQKDT